MFLTHLSVALFIGLLIVKNTALPVSNHFFVAVILLGSLLPDIDSSESFLGSKVKVVSLFFKHRGPFHSLLAMIFFMIILFLITPNLYYLLALMIGYLSHLFFDSLTPKGIPLLWPSKARIRGIFKTTGLVDIILLVVFVFLDLLLLL
jgi:inner membrane protein